MPAVVKPKPACRNCGATVEPFRRCPKCGKRNIGWSLVGMFVKH